MPTFREHVAATGIAAGVAGLMSGVFTILERQDASGHIERINACSSQYPNIDKVSRGLRNCLSSSTELGTVIRDDFPIDTPIIYLSDYRAKESERANSKLPSQGSSIYGVFLGLLALGAGELIIHPPKRRR